MNTEHECPVCEAQRQPARSEGQSTDPVPVETQDEPLID